MLGCCAPPPSTQILMYSTCRLCRIELLNTTHHKDSLMKIFNSFRTALRYQTPPLLLPQSSCFILCTRPVTSRLKSQFVVQNRRICISPAAALATSVSPNLDPLLAEEEPVELPGLARFKLVCGRALLCKLEAFCLHPRCQSLTSILQKHCTRGCLGG